MKIKPSIFCVLVFILLFSSINADAANLTATSPPENEFWTKEYVDFYFDADVGRYVSIDYLYGLAYISYYDAENKDLWMAYEAWIPGRGNCPSNNNWNCVLIDSEGDVGKYSSINVINVEESGLYYHKIGIAYYDETNRSLKFAYFRSNEQTWTIYTVDKAPNPEGERGTYTSTKFNNNEPVIGYHTLNTEPPTYGTVKLAEYKGSGGTGCGGGGTKWSCQVVDRGNNTDYGSHVSIDFQDGTDSLYVAFFNSEKNSVDYAYFHGMGGGNCSNNNWNCITVDQGSGRGKFITLNIQDKMRFVYYDDNVGKIRYAEWVGTGGNCTSTAFNCYAVDTVGKLFGNYHYGLSMDVDQQGYPIIAYSHMEADLSNPKVNIARPALAYGELYGNCGDVPPGDLFLYWTCKTIDSGGPITKPGGSIGISVSPKTGFAIVAYSELNSYSYDMYLKVARQRLGIYLPLINK